MRWRDLLVLKVSSPDGAQGITKSSLGDLSWDFDQNSFKERQSTKGRGGTTYFSKTLGWATLFFSIFLKENASKSCFYGSSKRIFLN